jgi:hypothetical protein
MSAVERLGRGCIPLLDYPIGMAPSPLEHILCWVAGGLLPSVQSRRAGSIPTLTSATRGTVLARQNTTTTTTTAKSQDDSGVSVDMQRKMKSSGNGTVELVERE